MSWLDEYDRGPIHEVEVRCTECGRTWEVRGHYEYGTWWPERDDDLLCEGCGAEGKL